MSSKGIAFVVRTLVFMAVAITAVLLLMRTKRLEETGASCPPPDTQSATAAADIDKATKVNDCVARRQQIEEAITAAYFFGPSGISLFTVDGKPNRKDSGLEPC